MFFLIFLSFLNARDIEALRDHLLAIRERTAQALRILNRGAPQGPPGGPQAQDIPGGAWEDDPATAKQLETLDKAKVEYWDGITKGEASELIANLFKKARP